MATAPSCVLEKISNADFMNEVEKFPILYDKFDKEFKDKWKKKNAWEEIGRLSNLSANQAEEKYKSIRSSYGRWLKSKKKYPIRFWKEFSSTSVSSTRLAKYFYRTS